MSTWACDLLKFSSVHLMFLHTNANHAIKSQECVEACFVAFCPKCVVMLMKRSVCMNVREQCENLLVISVSLHQCDYMYSLLTISKVSQIYS